MPGESAQPVGSLWLLGATAAFSLGAVIDNPVLSVASTSMGVAAALISIRSYRVTRLDPALVAGMLALLVLALANTQVMARFSVQPGSYRTYVLMAALTAVCLVVSAKVSLRNVVVALAFATFLYGSLSVLIPNWDPVLKSDVYRAHVAAGEAVAARENPYSDAVVFESGDPNKPDGTLITGYPYPPPPLVAYGLVAAFSDPRVISFLTWLSVLGVLAWLATRQRESAPVALGALVLLAATPIWRTSLFMAWTEPLSLGLFVVALLGIRGRWAWGWVLLGIAFASKQYLVFLAPLALMYQGSKRPGWIAIGTAALVTTFPVIFGPADYYQAIIGNALEIGNRPDSQSINGLISALGGNFTVPTAIALLAVVCVLFAIWKRRTPAESLICAGVVVLATVFLTTSAFPNYWLLVAGLAAAASIAIADAPTQRGVKLNEPA
jgi:hypothetical protein